MMADSLGLVLDAFRVLVFAVWLTILISVSSFALGQMLGLPIALVRTANSRLLRYPAFVYTFALRGSPLLVQLFIVYYGLSQVALLRESALWPLIREPLYCAILAIGINSSAYVAEILRGGIEALPSGQGEAAQALGLSRVQRLRLIIFPQAYRAALPIIANEAILVLKASSLASTITLMEITGTARSLVTKTYAPFEVFAVAGIFYLALGLVVARMFVLVERRFSNVQHSN